MSISVLNTDAGLSGKTIINLEDAQTITGLKTFDRNPNPPFAVSAGSAVVPNLDADKVDGVEASAFAQKAANNNFTVTQYINDSANANMTLGLTLNQGTADDEIVALKSSDVAHGMVAAAETDTYGAFKKSLGTAGGLTITGLSATGLSQGTLFLVGNQKDAASATKSTAGYGIVRLNALSNNGAVAADGNLVSIDTNGTTRFIFDSDGDSHQDVGTAWTNFDDGDDIERLDAVAVALAREGDPLRHEFVKDFESRRAIIEAMPGKPLVSFNEDGHHFVNMSRLSMLHNGAIRQLARQNEILMTELASVKNELKLLRA